MELVHFYSFIILFNGTLCSPALDEYQEDMEDYQADYYNDSEYNYDTSRESINNTIEKVERRNPKFVTTSKRLMINDGGTIKLPCDVDQLGEFMLMWRKGEEIITLGDKILKTDSRIQVESHPNGNSLIISLAGESDAGRYTCQVNSPESKILVHNVDIRVAPVVSVGATKLEVKAGQTAQLTCTVLQGNPVPTLYWTRKSRMFRSGSAKLTGSVVELNAVTRKDSGHYSCNGDNGWGYIANSTIVLEVLHAPEIDQEETFLHTREGVEVEVTCTVHAAPLAAVEWYMNGRLLDPKTSVINNRGNRHTLYITGIGSTTHGKYMCRAVNPLGEASKTTEVSGRAKQAEYLSGRAGDQPDRYTLAWAAQSNSVVDQFRVQYRVMDGRSKWEAVYAVPTKVTGDLYDGVVLLENLNPGTEYMVQVDSKNIYGWSEHSNQFTFMTKAVEVQKPKAEEVERQRPKYEPSISTSGAGTVVARSVAIVILSYLFVMS